MSALACTLAAAFMFEAAVSPPVTDECPLTDNRCKAGLYERRSATAPTPAQSAKYLYAAYRSYLFLFDKTGDARDVCAARRALDASLAVDGQPQAQRTMSESMRADLDSRQRQAGADCRSVARRLRVKKTAAPLVAQRPAPEPPADTPPQPPTASAPPAHTADPGASAPPSPVKRTRTGLLADVETLPPATTHQPSEAILLPVPARSLSTEHRPGRGLVIAGGVTLGVGVALTAAAGFMGRRMVHTRQQIIALGDSVDGFATTDQDARDDALRADFRATQTQTLALAIGGATTVLVAVVLSAIGGRRMARAASRTALVPAPGGLVFHARF